MTNLGVAVTFLLLLVSLHYSSAITCHECVNKDTGDRIACEDPNSAEVETICDGAVSGCVQEKIDNVAAPLMDTTFRYCTAGGSPGRFAVTNKTSCMHYDEVEYMRYICTCNEDLCNDDCNSCRQLCDLQDGPLKVVEEEDEVVPEVKNTGITCHECRQINDGPPGACGGQAVEEVETYCGDNAVRGCVQMKLTSGSLFRRCYQQALQEFPEYFAGVEGISDYSSNKSVRGCVNVAQGLGSVQTCFCNEDLCNYPCSECDECDEPTTTTTSTTTPTTASTTASVTTTSQEQPTTTTTMSGAGAKMSAAATVFVLTILLAFI